MVAFGGCGANQDVGGREFLEPCSIGYRRGFEETSLHDPVRRWNRERGERDSLDGVRAGLSRNAEQFGKPAGVGSGVVVDHDEGVEAAGQRKLQRKISDDR